MPVMTCPSCKQKKNSSFGDYHYLESGLINVWIKGIEILKCDCGEEVVSIPWILELHRSIAGILLEQENQLSGREIKFLRKNMAMKAKDFASQIGVDNSTVSRWEHERECPSEMADRLIRLFYATRMGLTEKAEKLAKDTFLHINPEQAEIPIFLPVDQIRRQQCST